MHHMVCPFYFSSTDTNIIASCLDDEELEFLGSPWSEYSDHAQKYGIDVLRYVKPFSVHAYTPAALTKRSIY